MTNSNQLGINKAGRVIAVRPLRILLESDINFAETSFGMKSGRIEESPGSVEQETG